MKNFVMVISLISLFTFSNAKSVEELFFNKCANCHGDKAEESAFGKSKILKDLSEEEIVNGLIAYKAGTKDENGLGRIMESQVYDMTETDFINLAKFIKTLK